MGLPSRIIDFFPEVIPRGTISVDESHTFRVLTASDGSDAPKTVYLLDKAPYERVRSIQAKVDGFERTLQEGDDFATIDTDGDGELDSIEFTNSSTYPDDNTEFTVSYIANPIIERYTDAHTVDLNLLSDDLDGVISSRQVNNATGKDLDHIGSIFGELGRRQGRDDTEYRALLRSIIQSFNGRGTIPGLKFAISVAVNTTPDKIEIVEDFGKSGYEVNINTDSVSNVSSSILEIIDNADPSGVELLRPPVLTFDSADMRFATTGVSSTVSHSGLGAGSLDDGTI